MKEAAFLVALAAATIAAHVGLWLYFNSLKDEEELEEDNLPESEDLSEEISSQGPASENDVEDLSEHSPSSSEEGAPPSSTPERDEPPSSSQQEDTAPDFNADEKDISESSEANIVSTETFPIVPYNQPQLVVALFVTTLYAADDAALAAELSTISKWSLLKKNKDDALVTEWERSGGRKLIYKVETVPELVQLAENVKDNGLRRTLEYNRCKMPTALTVGPVHVQDIEKWTIQFELLADLMDGTESEQKTERKSEEDSERELKESLKRNIGRELM